MPLTLLHCRLLAIIFDLYKLLQLSLWWIWTNRESSTLNVDDFKLCCLPSQRDVAILQTHWQYLTWLLHFFILSALVILLLHLSTDHAESVIVHSSFDNTQNNIWNIRQTSYDKWMRRCLDIFCKPIILFFTSSLSIFPLWFELLIANPVSMMKHLIVWVINMDDSHPPIHTRSMECRRSECWGRLEFSPVL